LTEAFDLYKASQFIVVTESVTKKLAKVEKALKNLNPLGDGYVHDLSTNCAVLDGKFALPFQTYSVLYPHQRLGLYGARFGTEFCTRGCHWIPRLLA
jgi:hypothetical protein